MSEAQEPKKESKGVKETLEFVAGLKVVVPAAVEIAADKKLSMKDVKPVVEVVKKHEVLVDAIEGMGDILPEAKDLDTLELAQIGSALLEVLKESKAAYARGKAE